MIHNANKSVIVLFLLIIFFTINTFSISVDTNSLSPWSRYSSIYYLESEYIDPVFSPTLYEVLELDNNTLFHGYLKNRTKLKLKELIYKSLGPLLVKKINSNRIRPATQRAGKENTHLNSVGAYPLYFQSNYSFISNTHISESTYIWYDWDIFIWRSISVGLEIEAIVSFLPNEYLDSYFYYATDLQDLYGSVNIEYNNYLELEDETIGIDHGDLGDSNLANDEDLYESVSQDDFSQDSNDPHYEDIDTSQYDDYYYDETIEDDKNQSKDDYYDSNYEEEYYNENKR